MQLQTLNNSAALLRDVCTGPMILTQPWPLCVCISVPIRVILDRTINMCVLLFYSLSVGAGCTASWEEGCFVQEWAIYSWLFPQQQITGCSTVIQTTTCTRGCGDTACPENASHTPTALVRFTVQQSGKNFDCIFYFINGNEHKHILVASKVHLILWFPRSLYLILVLAVMTFDLLMCVHVYVYSILGCHASIHDPVSVGLLHWHHHRCYGLHPLLILREVW